MWETIRAKYKETFHISLSVFPFVAATQAPCAHAQSCLTFVTPRTLTHQAPLSRGFSPCPWGQSTGVGCHFLLQGISPTQGSNLRLLCFSCVGRQILYHCPSWEACNRLPGFKFCFHHLLAEETWANDLTLLNISFQTCRWDNNLFTGLPQKLNEIIIKNRVTSIKPVLIFTVIIVRPFISSCFPPVQLGFF